MKKTLRTILTLLCAVALVFNIAPAKVKAATELNAYLAYGNSDWSVMWSGTLATNNTAGATGTDAVVTGVGQYTVSFDFTGTEGGMAAGDPAFCGVIVTGCDTTFPGYIIGVDSIQVNGEDVDYAQGYTNDESGATRTNVFNTYCTAFADGSRSLDGAVDTETWNQLDASVLKDVKTLSVTFTLYDQDGNGPDAAAATDDAAASTDAAATDVPKTGVVSFAVVYGLGALATGTVALKRRHK